MADTPFVVELRRRREDLSAQIALLVEKVRAIDTLLGPEWSVHADGDAVSESSADSGEPLRPRVSRRVPKSERTRARYALLETCRRVIAEAGRPLTRKQLFERIGLKDLDIPADDPRGYISALLWKAPHLVVHLRDHGYWLADSPYEPLGYTGDPTAPHDQISRKGPPVSGLGRLKTEDLEPPVEDGPSSEKGGNPWND
jgi:hypothetical protein